MQQENRQAKVSGCGPVAIVVGETPPALCVSWEKPTEAWDSGFVISMSDHDPDEGEGPPSQLVCLACLVDEGDGQLGRGLDLAKRHGLVEWDPAEAEWFAPAGSGLLQQQPLERS